MPDEQRRALELADGLSASAREMAMRGSTAAAPLQGLTPRAARSIARLLAKLERRERLRARAISLDGDDTQEVANIAVSGNWRPTR